MPGQDVNYFVLGVLLVSSIAGVIVHIPAGNRRAGGRIPRVAGGRTYVVSARLSPPCSRTACFTILFPVAGAGVLPDPGKPWAKKLRRKRAGDGEINSKQTRFASSTTRFIR